MSTVPKENVFGRHIVQLGEIPRRLRKETGMLQQQQAQLVQAEPIQQLLSLSMERDMNVAIRTALELVLVGREYRKGNYPYRVEAVGYNLHLLGDQVFYVEIVPSAGGPFQKLTLKEFLSKFSLVG